MMGILKAPALKPGDTLALVAPAGPPDLTTLDRGVRLFSDLGFTLQLGKHVLTRNGYLAGTDAQRVDDINSAIRDPSIRGIVCARGGYGSLRVLDAIDYASLAAEPKVIIGYSDITALLLAIWKEIRLVTFHGPMPAGNAIHPWSLLEFVRCVTGTQPIGIPFACPVPGFRLECLPWSTCHENASGRLLGGCLSLLTALLGTPWEPAERDSIVILEDIGEPPYRIDRMLTQLRYTHWLKHCRGLLLGSFIRCEIKPDDPDPSPSLDEVFIDRLADLPIPVLRGIPVGHGEFNLTVPIGIRVQIESETWIPLESGVDRR
ncbi:LD-carboxypeptidase [bacterium]|nr:LD-carboxypeptidase [candidate division CSSED10-310 bacterium]